MKRICVFCGSRTGADPVFRQATEELGSCLVEQGFGLVFGGGRVGLMGVLADRVLALGGEVIGVLPEFLSQHEIAHNGLSELRIVATMHERKALMAELADGFIALPGGYGTLEEFFEIVTWAQLGLHRKPCGLLNIRSYYTPLLHQIEDAVGDAFVRTTQRSLIIDDISPISLLQRMEAYSAPESVQILHPDEI